MTSTLSRRLLSQAHWRRAVVFGAGYFLSAHLGSLLTFHPNPFTAFWPPSGVYVAALLLSPPSQWPALLVASLFANSAFDLIQHRPLWVSLLFWSGNTAEALVGAWLVRRFAQPRVFNLKTVVALSGFSAGLSTLLSATVGGLALALAYHVPPFREQWLTWWTGDMVGVLVVAPFVLTWAVRPAAHLARRAWRLEMALLLGGLLFSAWVAFAWYGRLPFALVYLILPFVFWAALRFEAWGAVTANLLMALLAVGFTSAGQGQFATEAANPVYQAVAVQSFLGIISFTALLLGAVQMERQHAENAVQKNEMLLRRLTDNMLDLVSQIDPDFRYQYISPSYQRILGYGPSDLLGHSVFEFVHPDDLEGIQREAQVNLKHHMPGRSEFRYRHWDGQYVWIETVANVLRDEAGHITGMVLSSRSITDRIQAQTALVKANRELTASVAELKRRNRDIASLNELSELLQTCQSFEEAHAVIALTAQKLFPDWAGQLLVGEAASGCLRVAAEWGGVAPDEPPWGRDDCWALRRNQPHWVDTTHPNLHCAHVPHPAPAAYLCLPFSAPGRLQGLLHLRQTAPNTLLPDATQQLALAVAEAVQLAFTNLNLRETLRDQALHDPLTGLYNRRYMEEMLARELHLAQREGKAVGLIMLDLDHFKHFNDTHGHKMGDRLLGALGGLLQLRIRRSDVACRYGGEEFLIILPGSSRESTCRHAEEIRHAVKQLLIPDETQTLSGVTVSLGVAQFPEHGADPEALVRAADAALYIAKNAGRDRVEVFAPPVSPLPQ